MKILKCILVLAFVYSQTQLNAQFNKGLLLDGCNNYLEVVESSDLLLGGDGLTIEAWVMPNCDDGNRMIVSKQWCNGQYGYYLSIYDGRLFWSTSPDGFCTNTSNFQTSNIQIPSGIFTHVAIVHDATSIKLFVNGNLVPGQFRNGSFTPIYPSFENIRIGAYKNIGGSYSNFFSGIIDELRFYNTPLTSQQISQSYKIPLSGNEPNLVLYYNMEDNTASGSNLKIDNKCAAYSQNHALSKGYLGSRPIIVSNEDYLSEGIGLSNEIEICGENTILELDLDAYKQIKWSSGETTKSINIANAGLYKVTVETEACRFLYDEILVRQGSIDIFDSIQLCTNDSIFFDNQWITKPGSYKEIITLQSGCDSITVLEVTFSDSIKTYLDFFISPGDSIIVGQELYTAQGNYIQNLKSEVGCDSTLFITIKPINEDLLFDFNKCTAIVGTTNMDYSEFTSTFSQISCCKVAMSNIYRENPMENKHSCTPGLGNTLAMCVSSSSSYTYTAGSDKSVIFKFEVTPEEGKYFQINKLKFFEKSPLMFDWVNGGKGSNNYPTKFGFRVLKNGVEIFRDEAIISKRDWNERKIDFANNEAFLVKEKAIYQFEFLPYCPIGNSATESVWDMENVSIFTSCLDKSSRILAGSVHDSEARPLVNVQVVKLQNEEIEDILTDEQGDFALTDGVNSDDCEISVLKSDDYLNGVSTLDLILMQRHILGLEDFDVARKYVAGDINLDTKVTASDIVALRKLILGITNKFGHEKSWRFVTDLPNFDKSSIIELNEHYFIEKGVKDLSGLDFTGIKIGDIDNDSNLAVNAENRNNYVEIIEYSIEKIGDNETNVHFYATSNLAINGLQVSLNPGDILNYEILDNQLSVERDQIHFTGENINIAYSSANSHVINTQKPLFTLKLRSKSSDKFRGLNSQFKNELYSSDLTKKNIHLNQRNNSNAFMIMSSKPNPFKGETLIEYSTNCSGPLRAEIYNITGTLIFSETIIAEKGRNEFKITSNQLENKAGMYFLKLVSGTESRELKILMVN
jgi:hypothetical protein